MTIKAIPTTYKNIQFKSKLEALYAKLFDKYNIKWIYEPKTFDFGTMGYGTGKHLVYYTPDFYLPKYNIYIEIKGIMNLTGRSKEEWFYVLTSNKLLFGTSFYPESEPTFLYEINQPFIKNDGYSEYIANCGIKQINFLNLIKNDKRNNC